MRKMLAMIAMAATLAATGGQWAYAGSATFHAKTPCGFSCPYWTGLDSYPFTAMGDTNETACRPAPVSPAGSYDQTVRTVPPTANSVTFSISPMGDFDSFICSVANLGTAAVPRYYIAAGTNDAGSCLVGCAESITIDVTAYHGMNLMFRVYNWADHTGTVSGTIDFT